MMRHLFRQTDLLLIILAAAICAAFPTPLLGHVAIFPQTAEAGARHQSFYIRAPVEKEIPVVELGFEVDEKWVENGGDLTFQDVPDWDLHVEFDQEERVKKVYWTATEGGALPMTFQMIFMRVNVPDKPGVYPFASWQKYTDGSVVWWNEARAEGVRNPYPTVRVKQDSIFTAGPLQMSLTSLALLALGISLYCLFTVNKLIAARNQEKQASDGK
ncbi:DUF1775 domain-containing protein [Acidobacteria bacterium AH-259-D05]|nr:DUF1775 domain-containing protein [Acidobacteria bacterium AH-259-D05]